ncbi:C2 calcium-dependent membrane targeting [Macleaya cordata]|uniref:C2 calcium-dependent membrane targeting n=1 Tax=Macleaya cordata TaxID=56857 RepID=A0A200R705_MACCD|nr:C2 calcium-dependent membrane targeting [Macleaya cordata]
MDSFNETTGFCYDPNSDTDGEGGFSGLLEIYVHHARNIHNICIYDNQDVYAKFSLTYSPDETLSTRIVNGGGKNPEFNENLRMKITQLDAVLKCEIWMLSRARCYMEDQLLGFALVPMSSVAGKGKVTQDFTLSSTDLFHSPAGTVQLTLFLHTSLPINLSAKSSESAANSSITSEVVLLDRKVPEVISNQIEYGSIEFPDINVVKQNQQMVSEYFERNSTLRPVLLGPASFLHLGAFSQSVDDYEMNLNSSEENCSEYVSPNGSIQNSGFFGSTTTSLSDDRNSSDSMEKKIRVAGESSNSHVASISADVHQSSGTSPETPTSKKESEVRNEKDPDFSNKEDESSKETNMSSVKFGPVFTAPLGNINLEAEQTAMQQQIVDMYMRSMQQFTESLAKMKLPMDLDKPEPNDNGDVIQQNSNKKDLDKKKMDGKKKDGSRVFYGSRAFF